LSPLHANNFSLDPFGSYQRNFLEGMQEIRNSFKIFARSTVAPTETTEHLLATAEKASRGIQQTRCRLVAETKDLDASPQS
jgi:hypothetical protein